VQIHLITVGRRPPAWVEQGYQEFARRLPAHCGLRTTRVEGRRLGSSASTSAQIEEQGERLLSCIPDGSHVVALEVEGELWTTEELAQRIEVWRAEARRHVALLIGGPEGLSAACRNRAHESWSLSRLTLPHAMVRLIVAEQIYRAWSLLNRHPYHRSG
jgi:23S rRNA (pseudouridine1915-N3)-methyltransferase